jgi:hypothetical protein
MVNRMLSLFAQPMKTGAGNVEALRDGVGVGFIVLVFEGLTEVVIEGVSGLDGVPVLLPVREGVTALLSLAEGEDVACTELDGETVGSTELEGETVGSTDLDGVLEEY